MQSFSILSYSLEEKEELIELFKGSPKWLERLEGKSGPLFVQLNSPFRSPGIPDWAEPLPEKLDIGKRIRVKPPSSFTGRTGTIRDHFICADDCSGTYGLHKYFIINDDKTGNTSYSTNDFSILVKNCEFID